MSDDAADIRQGRPDAAIEVFDPRIDGDKAEGLVVLHGGACKLAADFDDVGLVHETTPKGGEGRRV